MNCWIYATQAEALRAVAAIDALFGPTEVLRTPAGLVTRPRLTWAIPIALRDGTWAVPVKPRLSAVEGRATTVGGQQVTVPLISAAVVRGEGDRL